MRHGLNALATFLVDGVVHQVDITMASMHDRMPTAEDIDRFAATMRLIFEPTKEGGAPCPSA